MDCSELVHLFEGIGLDTKKALETVKNKKLSALLKTAVLEVPL
jgi:Glutaminyl-tRNA synthetase, non-specific RNA binding region part 1